MIKTGQSVPYKSILYRFRDVVFNATTIFQLYHYSLCQIVRGSVCHSVRQADWFCLSEIFFV